MSEASVLEPGLDLATVEQQTLAAPLLLRAILVLLRCAIIPDERCPAAQEVEALTEQIYDLRPDWRALDGALDATYREMLRTAVPRYLGSQ